MSSAVPSPILASAWPSSMTSTRVPGSSQVFASQSSSERKCVDRSTSCLASAIPPETEIRERATASEYGFRGTRSVGCSDVSTRLIAQTLRATGKSPPNDIESADRRLPVPGLTSHVLIALLAVVAGLLFAGVLGAWPRLAGPGARRVALRVLALCAVQASILSLAFVIVNRSNDFYSSSSDLFGRYGGGGNLAPLMHGAAESSAQVSVLVTPSGS